MKRRNFNERIQLIWMGGSRPNKKKPEYTPQIPSPSDLLDKIRSLAQQLEVTINRFDKSTLLPLIVFLNMARSAQVRRGYIDSHSPAFIEYATALAMKSGFQETNPPSISDGTYIRNKIEQIFWLCNEYCSSRFYASDGSDEDRWSILSNSRLNYMLVRGETYDNFFLDGALRFFDSQAKYLEQKFGFNIKQAIMFTRLISHLINERIGKEKPNLKIIFSELANTEVNSTVWPLGIYKNKNAKVLSFEELSFSNTLPDLARNMFLFSESELLQNINSNDRDPLKSFLNWASIEPGHVESNFITPLDFNPLENRPIVKFGQNYIFHTSAYLARSLVYSLDKELKSDSSYGEKYNQKKSHYLEWESLRLFRKIMPTATTCHGLKYSITQGGKKFEYELDGLVQYDNNLFLIECATHPVTRGSKKGMKEPIIHDIQQSVERTFKQAQRAEKYIRRNDQPAFTLSDGSIITLDNRFIKNYFLISVTFDSFDVFTTNTRRLNSIGLFLKDEYPLPIYIENLKLISDFIEFPSQFIHYLKKRRIVPKNIYASDEMDYFGCYFISNLDIPMPKTKHPLRKVFIVNATSDFDQFFYYQHGLRSRVPKPGQFIPKHLRSILNSLEKIHDPGYTDITCLLLDIDYPFRKLIEENIILSLRRSKENGGALKDFTVADPDNGWGFTYFCGDGRQKPTFERMMLLHEYCLRKIDQTGITSWVGIICDTSIRKPFVRIFLASPPGKRKRIVTK